MKHKAVTGGIIYTTANYELFERCELQRKIKPGNLKKIRGSMEKYGFRLSCPISVFEKNGKLHLNNGHHRLFVAMQLGIPVYYVVEKQWLWEELLEEGLTGQRWEGDDIVHLHVVQGNEDYKTLMRYVGTGIPTRFAASMLHGETAGSGNAIQKVLNGTFKVNTTELIDKLVDFLKEMRGVSSVASTQAFLLAIAVLLRLEEFDVERMKQKLRTNGAVLEKVATRDQMLEQLQEVYNHRVNALNKIPLLFLAKQLVEETRLKFNGK